MNGVDSKAKTTLSYVAPSVLERSNSILGTRIGCPRDDKIKRVSETGARY